jgi:hypothetical protein
MVNPGAFQGTRKQWLLDQKEIYQQAVQGGYAKDCIADIQRRYLKRYPIDLPHDEEPSEEHLSGVDDNAAEPELDVPDNEAMDEETYLVAMKSFEERHKLVTTRKKVTFSCPTVSVLFSHLLSYTQQIRRWMAYQYAKDNDLGGKESGADSAYEVLMRQLTGVALKKPKKKSAQMLWAKSNHDIVEDAVKKNAQFATSKKGQVAGIRQKVIGELFKALDEEDQKGWEEVAKEEHEEAINAWKKRVDAPISNSPEDRQ